MLIYNSRSKVTQGKKSIIHPKIAKSKGDYEFKQHAPVYRWPRWSSGKIMALKCGGCWFKSCRIQFLLFGISLFTYSVETNASHCHRRRWFKSNTCNYILPQLIWNSFSYWDLKQLDIPVYMSNKIFGGFAPEPPKGHATHHSLFRLTINTDMYRYITPFGICAAVLFKSRPIQVWLIYCWCLTLIQSQPIHCITK